MRDRGASRRSSARLGARTIADFGRQWTRFRQNEGYYGSLEVLADVCEPLLALKDVRGARVAEIGSGTGRIVRMLLEAGAAHVVALEPSAAYDVLRANVADCADRVECVHATGDALPRDRAFDLVVSIGVLHHVPDPAPVVAAAREALRPGGRCLVWLYGREGNRAYLAFTAPLRLLTTRLPPAAVLALAKALNAVLKPYTALCRRLPLPLWRYLLEFFARMDEDKKVLIIYDQLKPAYARYYARHEAIALLTAAGFVDVRAHHRRGYSWTVVGTRP
jgi:SAM-dependent methyltransferase